ncbi:MAG: ammonia-forming cytochrome c nitrite reductase subunit c552 [Bacteroidales bacterium]|nr:ammonia-forming cytochrome c nitrite reductase subunit c552 [Bacteroidales bacterium]
MKRLLTLAVLLFATAALTMVSCTKEGPAGPAGTNGTNGVNGENGIDGQDGTATCIECHDASQGMFAKVNQWEHSVHATGGTYERNGASCAPCHTSQGFLEVMAAGTQETAEDIMNPNPVNCYTCHSIHSTYTTEDWDLTYKAPVTTWHMETTYDDAGDGNLCMNCHQARVVSPMPVAGGEDVTLTSKRFGPHHGPQSQIINGTGTYEFAGMTKSAVHKGVDNGCVGCHMGTAVGVESGGHTFNPNFSVCADCHGADDVEAMVEDLHAEVEALMVTLAEKLRAAGIMNADDTYAVTNTPFSADVAGAFLNYKFVEEDKSMGVHNPSYVKNLLEDSIDALAK